MPHRFLLFLLCAALALPAPLARGQSPDFASALSGSKYPLTLKVKDLNRGWCRVTLGNSASLSVTAPQGFSQALLDNFTRPNFYYTKGETVSIGTEMFLVAYHPVAAGRSDAALNAAHSDAPSLEMSLVLSLVNVRQIAEMGDVQAFTPQTLEDVQKQVALAAEAASASNLKQIALAFTRYTQDNDEKLPPMQNAAITKKAIFPYVKNDNVFQYPQTHEPYLPNTSLSGRTLASFDSPSAMVIYYEAVPAPDGTRGVAFLDGHVKRIPESQWPALKAASHVSDTRQGTIMP